MYPIFYSVTHFPKWPIFHSVTHFFKCGQFFGVILFYSVDNFSKLDPIFHSMAISLQRYPFFWNVSIFCSVTFFQMWPSFKRLTYIFKCDTFFTACVTHIFSVTHFLQCDPYFTVWPIFHSVTYFFQMWPIFYSLTHSVPCSFTELQGQTFPF